VDATSQQVGGEAVMPDVVVRGQLELRLLAARLREAGTDGQGLKRELLKSINDAARPLAEEISSDEHLRPYVPDRYAAVLAADLTVRSQKLLGRNPTVRIRARNKTHRRRIRQLDRTGVIYHPLFGNRRKWFIQRAAVSPGFFTDPAQKAAPDIRDHVLTAVHEPAQKIMGHR